MDYPEKSSSETAITKAKGPRYARCPLCGCEVELWVQKSNRVKGQTWKDRMAYHLRTHETMRAFREGRRAPPAPPHETY